MKLNLQHILFIILLSIVTFGCIERREYPIEPSISYKAFYSVKDAAGKDSIGYLSVEFTDGDGDIGLSQSDTLPPYNLGSEFYYNFFITIYQKISNSFVKLETPYNSRIQDINPQGIQEDLAGDIIIEIDLKILSLAIKSKTIKMQAYIVDRTLHKSNTIETPVFVLN